MIESNLITEALERIGTSYTPLSDQCNAALISCAKPCTFTKGQLAVSEGQYYDKVIYLIKGSARAFYLKDGKNISDWFAFENEFICAINSFFLDQPSTHFIEFTEPTEAFLIRKEDFQRLADQYHDFERLARMVVTKTMLHLQQRIVAAQFETAHQKYENLLATRPDITQRISLSHIASYLGITFETLSRIRNPKKSNLT